MSPDRQSSEKRFARLRAILVHENGFQRYRLENFVGRQVELAHIRQHIEALLPTGGYLAITGLAGQGKSSIIAKLVDEHHGANAIHHFIPPNPGLGYQVSLLRDLLAQLIVKHGELPEFYVASENRAVLRNYFANALTEIGALKRQEVIFIDGLDQLLEDYNGERDLSFLPSKLPKGIVLVIGTRPDDAQKPLQMREPSIEYQLPNLRREDFDLLLDKRGITISTALADQIYQVMQQNALFLSLAAHELAEDKKARPEEIIRRVADNPENLFTLAMDRLGRTRRGDPLWNHTLKPILGVLLAAREPLTQGQIRHIITLDADFLKGGLRRLRGLVVVDGQHRYTLFHQKLYDYLRQDQNNPDRDHIFDSDEEEEWHKRLANWCEGSNLSVIWKDARGDRIDRERRAYARRHYISHLYYARDWSRLFAVLDEGSYGQAKVHLSFMATDYAQDLNLGRQAAVREGWTLLEGLDHLPHLWRYTLLLGSLNSRADQYPAELFQLLSALEQTQRALDLAGLLTDPLQKASALLRIAPYLRSSESGSRQLLLQAHASALSIEEPLERVWILTKIVTALVKDQQWEPAERVIRSIEDAVKAIGENSQKFEGYLMLLVALAETQQLEQAQLVCTQIETMIQSQGHTFARMSELRDFIASLVKAQQWELAQTFTTEAERLLDSLEDGTNGLIKDMAREKIAISFANAGQWERAEEMACFIEWSGSRASALKEIAIALLGARQWGQTYRVACEAEKAARTVNDSTLLIETLSVRAEALAEMQQWDQLNAISTDMENIACNWVDISHDESDGRSSAAEGLAKVKQWERAENVARLIQNKQKHARALCLIAMALLSEEQQERAGTLAIEAEQIAGSIKEDFEESEILCGIAETLAEAQQWEQAEKIADSLQPDFLRARALAAVGAAMTKAQQRERAHLLLKKAEEAAHSIRVPFAKFTTIAEIAVYFAGMQQWEEAGRLASEAVEAARALETLPLRSMALGQIAETFARARQWEWAEKAIHSMERRGFAGNAGRMLAVASAAAQQWERALDLARSLDELHRFDTLGEIAARFVEAQEWKQVSYLLASIENDYGRNRVLIGAAASLAQAQQWEPALVFANVIDVDFMRIEALGEIAACLVKAQQRERVHVVAAEIERLADSIEKDDKDGTHRKVISIAFAKAQYWQRAEELARLIKDDKDRMEALRQIAAGLAVGDQERLLHLVESLWGEAVTRKEAVQLLPLAHPLIALKPEIGSAFFEAFAWVDTFLRKDVAPLQLSTASEL